MRSVALKGLAGFEDPKTPAAILKFYPQLSPAERKDALSSLSSRSGYARTLAAAIDSGTVPKSDLTAELVRQLRTLKNDEVNQVLEKHWGTFRETSEDKKKAIEKIKALYRAGGSQPGDASRGRIVYSKICQQCHTLFGTGGTVGPDLTGSARNDLEYILQNIIDPNAVIPNDYRSSTLETKDERIITGIVKEQNEKSVTIVTQNERLTVPRKDIQALNQSEISMMPEGLLENLSDQEIRDLIYYLGRPGQVPFPPGYQP
jgi:putative heme-binding domain-containing protein